MPWVAEDTEASADMWVEPTEARSAIVGLYERVAVRSDEVIERLPLDAVEHVPWWPPEISRVTLHAILAHTVAEAQLVASNRRLRATVVRVVGGSRARLSAVGKPIRWERCVEWSRQYPSGGAPGTLPVGIDPSHARSS